MISCKNNPNACKYYNGCKGKFLDWNQLYHKNQRRGIEIVKNTIKLWKIDKKVRVQKPVRGFLRFENLPDQSGEIIIRGLGPADHFHGSVFFQQQLCAAETAPWK